MRWPWVVDKTKPTAPQIVYLRDVARVELAAQNYSQTCTLDGMPSVGLGIYQLPGANALAAGNRIRAKMEELARHFPAGLEYHIVFDTTPFVAESIRQVFGGLRDAIILVALVVLLFLQNWRAAVIPLVAVPVAIVGTFAVMAVLGFSLNTLSLFGLVLAIGIVVDDAIVVVENAQRLIEEGHPPKEAAKLAMDEVTGPVIAVALVLSAVFVPCVFISGITGEFFRQFAVTISASMILSAINSLTLSPALSAILLRPQGAERDPLTRLLDATLGWCFRLFDRGFVASSNFYMRAVRRMLRLSLIVFVIYGGLLYLTYWSFNHAPQGFIPLQDKGWLLVNVQLPDSASVQRTEEVMRQVAAIAADTPGVAHTLDVSGLSVLINASSSNYGSMFIILEPFEKRRSFKLNGLVIFLDLRKKYPELVRDAKVSVFPPPPVNGLGATGGFDLVVEDRSNRGLDALQRQADELIRIANANPKLAGAMTLFRAHTPQLYLAIDRSKVRAMNVSLTDVSQALQVYLGSMFVNYFNEFGRTWQVNVQADEHFRNREADIGRLQVRSATGQMVPLNSVVAERFSTGPAVVTRHNLYLAADVTGRTQLGVSSGEAITILHKAVASLGPNAMSTEWTGLDYMQIKAGDTAVYIFALGVTFVLLVLAALYESWSLPAAIVLVVPLGLLFSVAGVSLVPYMSVGIFTQIGFVVLVGLASKNAILIVEFAEQLRRKGRPLWEATLDACHMRLRPIIMTSCAFILGVVPLIVEGGAGAEMRRSLGVAVFFGMLGVTTFGIFLTPVFYFSICWLSEKSPRVARWLRIAGTLVLSLVFGLLIAFCLWRTNSFSWHWSVILGVSVGLLTGLFVLGVRRRLAEPVASEK